VCSKLVPTPKPEMTPAMLLEKAIVLTDAIVIAKHDLSISKNGNAAVAVQKLQRDRLNTQKKIKPYLVTGKHNDNPHEPNV
jgi:hypothetical protein